jgi:NADP-dependent 3-hydroxy acid dehydrogenase YdfG
MTLENTVVAVTGASSGIGEATARLAAQKGAAVSLAARRADRIEALAEELRADGGRAVAIATDVSDEAQARNFVERTREELGGLDHLVNNAGLMLLGLVEGADTEEWRRMIDVNLYGVLYTTHAAFGHLKAQGHGTVVNVSSVAGRIARAGSGVYNLTKWGVGAFSEALRQELAPAGVRVVLVEPGAVATELLSHNSDAVKEEAAKSFDGVTPLAAEDIARAIVFALEQPENVSINEVLVRPTTQAR